MTMIVDELATVRLLLKEADEETRRGIVADLVRSIRDRDPPASALDLLVAAMGDPSWRVRREASEGAAAWPEPAHAAELLVAALHEAENVGRRNALVEAVVQLGRAALPALLRALRARPAHRKLLVDALGAIGDSAASEAIIEALADEDPNVRIAAAEALGSAGGAEVVAALTAAMEQARMRHEQLFRLAALDALSRRDAQLPVAVLLPLLDEAPLVIGAVKMLGHSRDESASAALIRVLGHSARSVRESALIALRTLHAGLDEPGREAVKRALRRASLPISLFTETLAEGKIEIRRAIATVLGLIGHRDAAKPLISLLADPDVRDAAIESLVTLGQVAFDAFLAAFHELDGAPRGEFYAILPRLDLSYDETRVQSLLQAGLEDEDEMAAMRAADALGELGTKESIVPLFRALEREGPVGDTAARALGLLGSHHYDELRGLIAGCGFDTPLAVQLCRILGACGRAADLPLLRFALGSESPQVRKAAADAVSSQGPDSDIDAALVFALADESLEVRTAAARSLGMRGVASALVPLIGAAREGETAARAQATRAIGVIAQRTESSSRVRAIAALRQFADGDDPASAALALEALTRLELVDDEPRLLSALESADPEVVKVAVLALGRRQEPLTSARWGLERALGDGRWDVRRAAAHALGALGEEGKAALRSRREHEKDPMVNAAIDAALVRERS
jgi:HEAT repeat protein